MIIELTIFHTNDIHNKLPEDFNFPVTPDLLLDGGDAIGGSNTVFRFSEPILRKMKALGYHGMALGNREFHYIRSIMYRRREEASFPFLSANLLDLTGRTEKIISPFLIKEIKDLKVAILGLTVQILPPGSFWEKIFNFKFLDPLATAEKYVPELRKQADLLIILSHLGKDMDIILAGRVPGIDLIIGGHSHTPLDKPLEINKTLIVQAGCLAKSFGTIKLNMQQSDKGYFLESFNFKIITINE
ncbi:MAG: Trifunctional nucleotide phosphoesterase protein YfkN precursor [bacterium ADurb.Bin363]|nr:MAG: Trifunctional nucleotide phosphoesterase protein YfkN precursor [bacterium ADurb.Bin363]